MNIRKIFGLRKKTAEKESYPYKDVLHLWEDDYLMLELLPYENAEFVKAETNRINEFARENRDGIGFTDITPVENKPIKTIEKLIDIADVFIIMVNAGLERISQFHMQGVGLLQGNKAPLGYGTNKFAVMCDIQNGLLQNIYVTGHTETEEEKKKLVDALLQFGQTFNFIAVNWHRGEYYNLFEKSSVSDFVAYSCHQRTCK